MPRSNIPYRNRKQQSPFRPPVSTHVPTGAAVTAVAAIAVPSPASPPAAPLVCAWCSATYGTPAVEAHAYCAWPTEHARQSHGLCGDCFREYIHGVSTMLEWAALRREHQARLPAIFRGLLRLQGWVA